MLARGRAIVVDRVAPDRDDLRVARAPRIALGEPLRERALALPPLHARLTHDPPDATAVAVAEHGQVVHVAELVQQDTPRVPESGLEIDDTRPLRVDAARRAREARAPRQPERDPPGDRRHERVIGPRLPVAL